MKMQLERRGYEEPSRVEQPRDYYGWRGKTVCAALWFPAFGFPDHGLELKRLRAQFSGSLTTQLTDYTTEKSTSARRVSMEHDVLDVDYSFVLHMTR